MKKITVSITSGPSREELFDALRLAHEGRKMKLTLDNNGKEMHAETWLHTIGIEDGSGQSWNIVFSIPESFIITPYPIKLGADTHTPSMRVTAYYSTRSRKGQFTVEIEEKKS